MRAAIRESRNFWSGKRALVTGACGFLGGHICRALCVAGAVVTALDCDASTTRDSQLNATGLREHLTVVEANIVDREAMQNLIAESDFDFIFHIAAGATVIKKALNSPY